MAQANRTIGIARAAFFPDITFWLGGGMEDSVLKRDGSLGRHGVNWPRQSKKSPCLFNPIHNLIQSFLLGTVFATELLQDAVTEPEPLSNYCFCRFYR